MTYHNGKLLKNYYCLVSIKSDMTCWKPKKRRVATQTQSNLSACQ